MVTSTKRKLTPAQQPKKRYLFITLVELTPQGIPIGLVSGQSEEALSASEIQRSLNNTFVRIHGEIQSSKTHLKLIQHKFDVESSTHSLILRTTVEAINETRQTIALLTWLSDRQNCHHYVIPNLHSTSGVLKTLRERMGFPKKEE